jgi:hypothetical protein
MNGVRFDIRLPAPLGPVLRSFIAPGGEWHTCRPSTVIQIRTARESDLLDVYERLIENDLEVIAVRRAE